TSANSVGLSERILNVLPKISICGLPSVIDTRAMFPPFSFRYIPVTADSCAEARLTSGPVLPAGAPDFALSSGFIRLLRKTSETFSARFSGLALAKLQRQATE